MKDAELIAEAILFRSGILGGRSSDGMCAAVCLPLQGYLSAFCNIATEVIEGEVDIEDVAWCNHVWLRLPDGRVLDPTIDQFNAALGKQWPATYLGAPVPEVHRQRFRLTEDIEDVGGTATLRKAIAI